MKNPLRNWLSRFALVALAFTASLAMVVQDADARRLGGGGSFGRQSSNVSKQSNQAPANTAPRQTQTAPAAPTAPQQPNRWLGPLAGLAAGIGLAALFSHFGMGGAMASMLGSFLMIALIAVAGMFIWRMLKGNPREVPINRREPAYGGAVGDTAPRYEPPSTATPLPGGASNSVMSSFENASTWGIPTDFDKEGFARSAKVHFIRLQAAWDAKDLADIREFSTPEMYAEIKMQLADAKDEKNQTEVVDLDAEVLGVESSVNDDLASVRFKGTLREQVNGPAEPFEEVWNLVKPKSGRSGWLLAGIQQIH
jgi:predicted lipid-binding transport protein (Tim44 family)